MRSTDREMGRIVGELPTRVSAVVFDCDGLLLDTEACWSRAEASLFADHGFGFGPVEKGLLIGRTLEAGCANMAEYFGRPGTGPDLQRALLPRVDAELAAGVEPMRGAVELLELLAGRVPVGVATNSRRAMLDVALDAAGIAGHFAASVAVDEVTSPKPAPELYLRAFELLSAIPGEGVALEDSSTGIAAARAAGPFLITVPSERGQELDGDLVSESLDDPRILAWAQTVVAG